MSPVAQCDDCGRVCAAKMLKNGTIQLIGLDRCGRCGGGEFSILTPETLGL